ncbi:MAG: oligosaccharide flippase family protein [Elusimicrobia bacterium]|nr:oligosaccharide flippase family protein [Elusimicrobiota bacterium]
MEQAPRSERFVRNVGASVVGQLGVLTVSFLLTPKLIHALGVEAYGLYILLQAAVGYVSLFCLGAGAATIKHVAERAGRGGRGLREALRHSAALHLGGSLCGAVALFALAGPCAHRLFRVPAPLVGPAIFVLRCAAVGAVFASLNQSAATILQGFQRFDWQNALSLLQGAALVAGATALAVAGFGINGVARWYAAWSACVAALSAAAVWRLARRRWAGGGAGLPFGRFLKFGLSVWTGSVAWIVTFQFDRLFIAHDTNLAALTFYSVPANLLQRLQFFPAIVGTVLLPMFSEIGNDEATTQAVYLRGVRSLLFIVLPALALLFCLMPQFLGLWLGGEFGSRSVWPARLLVAAQAFLLLNQVPNAAVTGRGKPLYMSAVAWGQAVISVISWPLLIGRLDILGVALGSLLAQMIPTCLYLGAVHRRVLKIPLERFLRESLLKPLGCAALLLAAVFPIHAEASSWPRLMGIVAAGLLLYAAAAWAALEKGDKDLLRRLARRRLLSAPTLGS